MRNPYTDEQIKTGTEAIKEITENYFSEAEKIISDNPDMPLEEIEELYEEIRLLINSAWDALFPLAKLDHDATRKLVDERIKAAIH